MRLRGDSQNVCQGLLEIEGNESESWIPVNNSNMISPEVSCNQMFCGTNASQIIVDKGMQLNCTGNTTEKYNTIHNPYGGGGILTFVIFHRQSFSCSKRH